MNKQELIKMLNRTIEDYTNKDGFGRGVRTGLSMATFAIKRLYEPEKVVIPRFVADWIDAHDLHGNNPLREYRDLEIDFNEGWTNEKDAAVYHWVNENPYAFIDELRYGYEVEKEKLYYAVDEKGQTLLYKSQERGILRSNGIELEIVLSKYEHAPSNKYQLTEKEIKDYDWRYWLFAVEVAE